MLASEIEYILEQNENTIANDFAFYPNIRYIIVKKDKKVIVPVKDERRLYFDMTNDIMEIVICRPYSTYRAGIDTPEYPSHNNYDEMMENGITTVYEHLTDKFGNLVVDYYPFDSIVMIHTQEV
jgi:hypothetical protein